MDDSFGWRDDSIRIAVVCTVYNRRIRTLAALRAVAFQTGVGSAFTVEAFVFDDGSDDGTAEDIRQSFPSGVHVERGPGEFYWARGMARAQEMAVAHDPDYLLWLNDDVLVREYALEQLLETSSACSPPAIAIGAMADPDSGQITYSGTRLQSQRPGSLQIVVPDGKPTKVDSFHGNLVMVPRHAYSRLGTIDRAFAHAYGDNDYGLRARSSGIPILLAPSALGTCKGNPSDRSWTDTSRSRRSRTKDVFVRKGMPISSHFRYNVRHGGPAGLFYAGASYGRAMKQIWFER